MVRVSMRWPLLLLPALCLLGCDAEPRAEPPQKTPAVTVGQPPTAEEEAAGIRYIPRDSEPRLVNQETVVAMLKRHYPDALVQQGVDARVTLWLFVDESGAVAEKQIQKSSGYESIDQAALQLADSMAYSPAEHEGTPVGVWIAQAVEFRAPE